MALVTQNLNENKLNNYNQIIVNKNAITYRAAENALSMNKRMSAPDSISINNKFLYPVKEHSVKSQVNFTGLKFNAVKEFVTGVKGDGGELLHELQTYINPENVLLKSLEFDIKRYNLHKAEVNKVTPFKRNLFRGLTDFPVFIYNKTRSLISKDFKQQLKEETEKKQIKGNLLGLWMNVNKFVRDFEKVEEKGAHHGKIKEILKQGISQESKQALSSFFKENKLKELYSYSEGNEKGLLAKEEKLQEFCDAISCKSQESKKKSFLHELKKDYVNIIVNKKIDEKTGSILPNFSTSSVQFLARVVSGVIPAWFVANDFYNLRMSNSNNKKEAKQEWKSKLCQENFRIGIYAYQGYVLNTIFQRLTNKSISFALLLNVISAAGSNILSRVFTNRPVLPVSVEKATALARLNDMGHLSKADRTRMNNEASKKNQDNQNNPFEKLNTYKNFKRDGNNSKVAFGANALVKKIDEALAKKLPAIMEFKAFKEGYEKVKLLYKDDSDKMLELTAKCMGIKVDKSKLTINHIEEAAQKNNGKVIIGNNGLYRFLKASTSSIILPATLVVDLGRLIVNAGRFLMKKAPIKHEKEKCYYTESHIKNMINWADKAHEKVQDKLKNISGKITDPKNKDLYEEMQGRYGTNKNFFSTKVMEYGADVLSNLTKLTGFVTVPFLAVDAYNVTLGKTKDKDLSMNRTKQRAAQDTTRQGVSYWFVKVFNNSAKNISNASLWGSGLVIGVQCFAYEAFTRVIAGQPILPTTHEKMNEVEKNRAKSKNWFVKLMAGRLKTNSESQIAPEKQSIPFNKPVASLSTNANNPPVSELYKKFASNNN